MRCLLGREPCPPEQGERSLGDVDSRLAEQYASLGKAGDRGVRPQRVDECHQQPAQLDKPLPVVGLWQRNCDENVLCKRVEQLVLLAEVPIERVGPSHPGGRQAV